MGGLFSIYHNYHYVFDHKWVVHVGVAGLVVGRAPAAVGRELEGGEDVDLSYVTYAVGKQLAVGRRILSSLQVIIIIIVDLYYRYRTSRAMDHSLSHYLTGDQVPVSAGYHVPPPAT